MKRITAFLVLLLGPAFTSQLFAQDVLRQELSTSVANATKALEQSLNEKELTIFATINHMEAAKKMGLTMKPAVVIIFGNPKVGTELMNSNMEWSYELPLKIAIYEDSNGKIWAQTRLLAKGVMAPNQEKRLAAINNLLAKLIQIKE